MNKSYYSAIWLKTTLMCIAFTASFTASVGHAEVFGSLSGRTANFSSNPQLAVEATFATGEFESADYRQLGLRVNYKYTSQILLFGDLGKAKLNSVSENSFGIGAFYSLANPILGNSAALKASIHQVKFGGVAGTGGGGLQQQCTTDFSTITGLPTGFQNCVAVPVSGGSSGSSGEQIRNIAAELLISGATSNSLLVEGSSWYANGGIQILTGGSDDETYLAFGAGVVLPFTNSEAFAGFDFVDDIHFGAGYRYFVK